MTDEHIQELDPQTLDLLSEQSPDGSEIYAIPFNLKWLREKLKPIAILFNKGHLQQCLSFYLCALSCHTTASEVNSHHISHVLDHQNLD